MSIRMMSLVWTNFGIGGTAKLAMLALADYSNDDGENIYPSIRTLAKKMSCSESQARRTLHSLIDDGYVRVVGNAYGGAPGSSRRYRIVQERLNPGMDAAPRMSATSRAGGRARAPTAHVRTARVDARACADAREGWRGCDPNRHEPTASPSQGETPTLAKGDGGGVYGSERAAA
jgi:hypothetical protein